MHHELPPFDQFLLTLLPYIELHGNKKAIKRLSRLARLSKSTHEKSPTHSA